MFFGLLFHLFFANAQQISNYREFDVVVNNDTIQMDSLSIIDDSEIIYFGNLMLDSSWYQIDYIKGVLILNSKKSNELMGKKLRVSFRVFPLSFSKSYQHKNNNQIEQLGDIAKNPFLFEYEVKNEDIFYLDGLNKSGSISRGVGFGNNQDLSVNSNLNLQLGGKISDNINILASISDDNIPIQAEGNTQQLQDFDQVYIQLFSDEWKLTAGDFYLERPKSYFMNFNKKAQGGSFQVTTPLSKKENAATTSPSISAAVSRGKFARNKINGIEGNQGPYRLRGAENENFIIILSGTEQVFIDGMLLKRGNEFDYIIDYNTAELTFTSNRLITKDSRIVIEFQYSDRNFARTLMHIGNEFESKKLSLSFNFYSEQDSKNQPLLQDLDDNQKLLLSNIGDSLQNAIVPNIRLVEFDANKVLYKMIDTLGFDSVFVFSTNPDSAIYQLGFSFVGLNNGNYKQIQSSANGKVFEWQVPVGGISQGDFEPVILLVTPKQKQMTTLGGEYRISENSKIMWEGAISKNDINTFSDKNSGDDVGYAFKMNTFNRIDFDKENKKSWKLNLGTNYEYIELNFSPIERFRLVEFERDWNILNAQFNSDQHIVGATVGIEKKEKASITYHVNYLTNINEFNGIKNAMFVTTNHKGFSLKADGSFLKTDGLNNTEFLRHKAVLTKQMGWIVLGVGEETEQNKIFINQSDTLQATSFEFKILQAFIHNADTTKNKFMISYKQREDNAPIVTDFFAATLAEDVELSMSLLKFKNHKLRSTFTYRKLNIVSTTLSNLKPEETVLARTEYNGKFFKSLLTTNTYYEIGSGLEIKKEFLFVEVQPGQGTHTYIGDINQNGVKDLNEFEVAAFQDQANFIKIFTPTNEFIKTFTNQFNQGFFLQPESIFGKEKGVKKLISRFSNRTNYRASRKVANKDNYFNPFVTDINDSSLITINMGILNTFYFNRTDTKFGADYTYQDNKDKSLLTNGVDARRTLLNTVKARWNITRVYTLNFMVSQTEKESFSEFFSNRNFNLTINEIEPGFSFQPSVKMKLSLLFNYKEKTNLPVYGGEKSIAKKGGVELRYNIASKGSLRAIYNYIDNSFSETDNASLEFEMLEGLKRGINNTWEVSYQQNLSKYMQLSINYNGRKSENTNVIHAGGVQVRAFF